MDKFSSMIEDIIQIQCSDGRIAEFIIIPLCKSLAEKLRHGTYTREFAIKAFHEALKKQLQIYVSESKSLVKWEDDFSIEEQKLVAEKMLEIYKPTIKSFESVFKD